MTVFLGTLWSSTKHIEAPYMYDWEHGIALHAMQGTRASSRGKGEVSCVFSIATGIWGIFSSYSGDGHSKLEFVQRSEDSCLVTLDT